MVRDIVEADGKPAIMRTVEGRDSAGRPTALERPPLWSDIVNVIMSSGLKGADMINTLNKMFEADIAPSKYLGSDDDNSKTFERGEIWRGCCRCGKKSALYKELKDSSMKRAEPYIQPYFKGNKSICRIAENGTDHAQ